jgi:hypothetical protein
MNVLVDERITGINTKKLQEYFGRPDYSKPIDFWIHCQTVPPTSAPERTILVLTEPPITDHRIWLYQNLHRFHTVIGYNNNGSNLFCFADNPTIFPYNTLDGEDILREDTTIRTRKIYYAGMKSFNHARAPHSAGFINLYPLRHEIAQKIIDSDAGYCFGAGWPWVSKGNIPNINASFRLQKIVDIEKLKCDFILSLENGIMRNYLSEKFHDGMMVDSVMLYLGEPNIQKYVPSDCFVDLRQFLTIKESDFGDATGHPCPHEPEIIFDLQGMLELVATMSQEEYDHIIKRAREYRKSIVGKWRDRCQWMHQFIIDRAEGK